MADLVSVIMPSYNSEKFIAQSLESALAQTYADLELLVIDDGSTDGTLGIAQGYAKQDSRVKVLKMPSNGGAAESRNLGIQHAQGRYIAFLDSDDLWLPHKLERQIGWMDEAKRPFTYTAYDKIDEEGQPLGHIGVPPQTTYSELLKTCVIGCLTAVYDTQTFGKVLMPSIRKRQDFALWLKLLKQTPKAYGLNETLAVYRVRGDSISANKKSAAHYVWKLYREVEHLPLPQSAWYFSHYAVRGVLRTKFPSVARALGVLAE